MSFVMRTDDLGVTTGMWNLIHHIQIISFFAWNNRNLDDFSNLSLQLHTNTLCLYFLPPPPFMINNLCIPPRSRWAIWPKNVNNYSEDKIMKHNITTILLAGSRTGCPHISHYRRTTYSWVTIVELQIIELQHDMMCSHQCPSMGLPFMICQILCLLVLEPYNNI
jgi:hypothetical protein